MITLIDHAAFTMARKALAEVRDKLSNTEAAALFERLFHQAKETLESYARAKEARPGAAAA